MYSDLMSMPLGTIEASSKLRSPAALRILPTEVCTGSVYARTPYTCMREREKVFCVLCKVNRAKLNIQIRK